MYELYVQFAVDLAREHSWYQYFSGFLWSILGARVALTKDFSILHFLLLCACILASWDETLALHECLKASRPPFKADLVLLIYPLLVLPYVIRYRDRIGKFTLVFLISLGSLALLLDFQLRHHFTDQHILEELTENLVALSLLFSVSRVSKLTFSLIKLLTIVLIIGVGFLMFDELHQIYCPVIN